MMAEKRIPTDPVELGLLMWKERDHSHRLYDELVAQVGCLEAPRIWHDACEWFDNQKYNDDNPPPSLATDDWDDYAKCLEDDQYCSLMDEIRNDTTVSGYTLRWQGPGYGVAPDDYGYHACPCCNGNPCECHLPGPDPHYEDYLAAWDAALDAGELDDAADAAVERDELAEAGLIGYRVDLSYVGYEALLNGVW